MKPDDKNVETIATCFTRVNTHAWPPDMKKPVRKRNTNSIHTFGDTVEMSDVQKLINNMVLKERTRPQVSARKPMKCELIATPMKPADPKSPCSSRVK